jgi:hypothetical protein
VNWKDNVIYASGFSLPHILTLWLLQKTEVAEQPIKKAQHSLVAQLVEQLTVNQLVAGSSPAQGAKFKHMKG